MRSQVSNLGHSVDFLLVISTGTTGRRKIEGVEMERENLSFRSAELTVKMTRGSWRFKHLSRVPGGSPCGSDYKESTCNAGDTGSTHGLGRSPGEGHGYPLQYFHLWNPMDRGAWQGCSPWGCRESYTTEHVHTHTHNPHTHARAPDPHSQRVGHD